MRLFLLLIVLFQYVATLPNAKHVKDKASDPVQNSAQKISDPKGSNEKQIPAHQTEQANSYDPYQDCLYRWYLRATIIGVVGGVIGLAVLIRQSNLLRNSVIAAHKSADAVMDSEMAILSITEKEFSFSDNGTTTLVAFDIHNIGRTVAVVFAAEHLLQLGDDGEKPPMPQLYKASDEDSATSFEAYLPPDNDNSGASGTDCLALLSTVDNPPIGKLSEQVPHKPLRLTNVEIDAINQGKKTLWCYGFARYKDVFKRKFELRFCLRYSPNLVPTPGFISSGPAEFNRLTKYAEPN